MPPPLLALLIGTGVLGLLGWFFWPDQGALARFRQAQDRRGRVLLEDALKHILHCELEGCEAQPRPIANVLGIALADADDLLGRMDKEGLIVRAESDVKLTTAGRELALQIVRAHRLLERYMADYTGFEALEWHGRAERLEHDLSREEADRLDSELGYPAYDPHGDPIPTAAGDLVKQDWVPLHTAPLGSRYRIAHVEDEPETVYAQILAEGLHAGMELHMLDRDQQRVRFWAEGEEHVLAPVIAANIALRPRAVQPDQDLREVERLVNLDAGKKAVVRGIAPTCRAVERRRLMDFGILPGATIEAAFANPNGDPVAYRIRDTLIALRKEQANQIYIQSLEVAA